MLNNGNRGLETGLGFFVTFNELIVDWWDAFINLDS